MGSLMCADADLPPRHAAQIYGAASPEEGGRRAARAATQRAECSSNGSGNATCRVAALSPEQYAALTAGSRIRSGSGSRGCRSRCGGSVASCVRCARAKAVLCVVNVGVLQQREQAALRPRWQAGELVEQYHKFRFERLVELVFNAQRGGYITRTDLAAGYHHAMKASEYWSHLGFQLDGQFYCSNCHSGGR